MSVSVKALLETAHALVPRMTPDEARKHMAESDALVVDVRDSHEVAQTGKVKGAINVSRGMIEFRADATTPFYEPAFRKERMILLYCASGGRSALVGKVLKDMGYGQVHNIGGFKDAAAAGLEIEPA